MALPIPAGASVQTSTTSSALGTFMPNPGASPGLAGGPGRVFPASNFVPRGNRLMGFTVEIDMGNLWTLGIRWEAALRIALAIRLGEAADFIVNRAKSKLYPGHGVDTGKMQASLHKSLVLAAEDWMVAYDLEGDPVDTYYWVFVEFGHMTRAGNWWPGYHFLSSTLMESEALIKAKVFQAMMDTYAVLIAQKQFGF